MAKEINNCTLFFGDNLEILKDKFPGDEGYFDLIYLDPPFNSNRNYNVIFKEGLTESTAQRHAFEDSWHWNHDSQRALEHLITKTNDKISNLMQALEKTVGHNDVLAYLTMMTIRLIELHRVLKPTGSIYLHCDPTASHYLKIVMDAIFNASNFRNEIVWCYRGGGVPKSDFGNRHDIILRYSKSKNYYFNVEAVRIPYSEESLKRLKYRAKSFRGDRTYDNYDANPKGKHPEDWWEIQPIMPSSKERLGYPTQKPEKLLERIIHASSKEGDWILDPFCGCGTTVSVAERLKRKWVGIDISTLAINLIVSRLSKQFASRALRNKIIVDGLPQDIKGVKALFDKSPWDFEYWALHNVSALPAQNKTKEKMKGADKGIDGVITFYKDVSRQPFEYGKAIVQVKGGHVQRNQIATLKGDMEREKADAGLFISLEEPTRPMIDEAIQAGTFKVGFSRTEYPKIQILTAKDLLEHKNPDLPLGSSYSYHKEAQEIIEDNQSKFEFNR
jgi:site-specific DNA-methyltransferase (adenine-specific)